MGLQLKTQQHKWRRRLLLSLSASLVLLGLALVGIYVYWYCTGEQIIEIPAIQVANPGVEEEPVTEQQVKEYRVAPQAMRYLSIPDLNISNARILTVGLDKDNRIDSPINIFDVGWFKQSGSLGDRQRAIFLDGHNGGPNKDGVFKHLPSLPIGAEIKIERGDGKTYYYQVVENYSLSIESLDDTKMQALLRPYQNQETLSIMTCTGKWVQASRTYTHRNIVRAIAKAE